MFEPTTSFAFYQPGALAVFRLEHALFGENSGAYIVINYVLHVIISLGMWLVLRRIGVNARGAFLASGLFVLGVGHYGKEILWACTSGLLVSVILSITALVLVFGRLNSRRRGATANGLGWYEYSLGASIVLGIAPLFHESSLWTIPVVLVIVLIYGPASRGGRIRHAVPALLVLPVWLVVLKVISSTYAAYRVDWEAVMHAPVYLVRYLGFMLLPFQKTRVVALPGPVEDAAGGAVYVQLALGLAALLVLATAIFKASAPWRAMSAWLILCLVPFTVVRKPESWLELRYLYCASIPFCGLLGHGLDVIESRGGRMKRLAYVAIAGLVCMTVALIVLLERQYDRACG